MGIQDLIDIAKLSFMEVILIYTPLTISSDKNDLTSWKHESWLLCYLFLPTLLPTVFAIFQTQSSDIPIYNLIVTPHGISKNHNSQFGLHNHLQTFVNNKDVEFYSRPTESETSKVTLKFLPFFCSTDVWTQGFMLAGQSLYYLSQAQVSTFFFKLHRLFLCRDGVENHYSICSWPPSTRITIFHLRVKEIQHYQLRVQTASFRQF
jgi:hypothetical protein